MNRLLLLVIGIAIGIGAMLLADRPTPATPPVERPSVDDDDDDDEHRTRPAMEVAAGQLALAPAEIALAGLELGELAAARVSPEIASAGRVADAADLLGLLRDLRSARATATASRDVVAALGARVSHLRELAARGEITVARELATLEVEHRREIEAAAAREARVATLETALLARWGTRIAALAQEASPVLAPVETGAAQLVEFIADGPPPSRVYVAAGEQRVAAVPAQLIGPAASALGAAHGSTYLALASDAQLRAGMAVTVWLPTAAAPVDGSVLPASAVVWHRGAQWYYLATDDTHFVRRPVADALAYGTDFLLPAAQAPAGRVVLRGAQRLLAEEFRDAIPEEDDD